MVLGLTVLLGLTRCFPPPLDETGLKCDSKRPCSDGYVCFDGLCYRDGEVDAGPANWLVNGDLEEFLHDGGVVGWVAKPGTLTHELNSPHGGRSAVRLAGQKGDGGNSPAMYPLAMVPSPQTGQTWCVAAFVRTIPSDAGFTVSLTIRETLDGGTVIGPTAKLAVIGRTWTQMENAYTTTSDGVGLDVRVMFNSNPTNTADAIIIDDVRLKRSLTDRCAWP